ncbi:hypothetical protein DFH27DRAFT_475724 [Peziza echinospora]|nr:hypothetical protein DFH27DRAFT_475724 [Peziza echinospora]
MASSADSDSPTGDAISASETNLSASETKGLAVVRFPLRPGALTTRDLHLAQRTRTHEATTGTTLWLSSQVVALYLADTYAHRHKQPGQLRAIDLGAGIGATALVLASLGINVIATDLPVVINSVLQQNIENNIYSSSASAQSSAAATIDVKVLDWRAPPEEWRWDVSGWISQANQVHDGTKIDSHNVQAGIRPPFDLIISSDTVYEKTLVEPLVQTLHALCMLSCRKLKSATSEKKVYPMVLLSLERRDYDVVNHALNVAKTYGFSCTMVPRQKLLEQQHASDAVGKGRGGGMGEWDGVEIWKLKLSS